MDSKKKYSKDNFLKIPGVKEKLQSIADKGGFTVEELLTVIQKESNFDPSIPNKAGSGAAGLIQFMPDTAKDLGTTTEALSKMSELEQLFFVDKYFDKNHKKGTHPYFTVAYPKAGRMDPDAVIGDKNSKIAKQNPVWVDENGNVTPKSILNYVDKGVSEKDRRNRLIERKKNEIRKQREDRPHVEIDGKKWRLATDEDYAKRSEIKKGEDGKSYAPEFSKEEISQINKEIEQEKKGRDEKINAEKTAEEQKALAEKHKAEEKEKNLKAYNEKANNFISNLGSDKEEFSRTTIDYDKKNFKQKLPLEAIASGALGLLGLSQADNKLPEFEAEVSEATIAYLNESKRISEQGLPPELEAQAKANIAKMASVGIDNIQRNAGGNRALVMANLGSVDNAKMQAQAKLDIANMQAKEKAFAEYGKTLSEIDKFNKSVAGINYNNRYREAQQERAEGKALANASFSKMMNEIQYQRENAPGSANHMMKNYLSMKTTGHAIGLTKEQENDPTVMGSNAYVERQNKERIALNQSNAAYNKEIQKQKSNVANISQEDKIKVANGLISMEDVAKGKDVEFKQYQPSSGSLPFDLDNLHDLDSAYSPYSGEANTTRFTSKKGFAIDGAEKGTALGGVPDYKRLFPNAKSVRIPTGKRDKYGRMIERVEVQLNPDEPFRPYEDLAGIFGNIDGTPQFAPPTLSGLEFNINNETGYDNPTYPYYERK